MPKVAKLKILLQSIRKVLISIDHVVVDYQLELIKFIKINPLLKL